MSELYNTIRGYYTQLSLEPLLLYTQTLQHCWVYTTNTLYKHTFITYVPHLYTLCNKDIFCNFAINLLIT